MTPGNQASKVNKMLIKSVVPTPCFIKTASGGNKIFRIIVSNDITYIFYSILRYRSYTHMLNSKRPITNSKKK